MCCVCETANKVSRIYVQQDKKEYLNKINCAKITFFIVIMWFINLSAYLALVFALFCAIFENKSIEVIQN